MPYIQSILDAAIAAKHAPGFGAAVVTRDGATYLASAGMRSIEKGEPVADDTLFLIASCTKAVTSVAALKLVERGLLDLDEPVGKYLPVLGDPRVLTGFDGKSTPLTRPAKAPITLRHLLSHTSGLAYDFCNAQLKRYFDMSGGRLMGAEQPDIPLVFEPGEGWQYGIGIDWTGKLIEAASGKSLDAYMKESIFEPLGMHDTTFFPDEAQKARKATTYAKLADGNFVPAPFGMPPVPHFMMGGAGLHATASDYLKFLRAFADGGAPLLQRETFDLAMKNQSGKFDAGTLRSSDPSLSNDFEPLQGVVRGHGLMGLVNLEAVPGGRSARSLAWAGIANCYYWADPEARTAGVLMAQVLPFADAGILRVFDQIERAAYA